MSEIASRQDTSQPVNAPRVLRRAFVLAALSCRGSIEAGAGNPEAESVYARLLRWIELLRLNDEVEPKEHGILYAPLGQLDQPDVIEATWSVEGLAILAWALRLLKLPKHDELVDPFEVTDAVCFLNDAATEMLATAVSRVTAELKAYRELVYAVHCRLTDFERNRDSKNFTSWVERDWLRLLGVAPAELIADGDLSIHDRPISSAAYEDVQACQSATFRRHRAIVWLLGGNPIYSQTPVAT